MPQTRRDPATVRLDLVVLSNFLALGIIISAVPRYLHGVLHASRFETGAATTLYFVAALLVRPFIGAAVDRVGRRRFIVYPPIAIGALTLLYLRVHTVPGIATLRFVAGGLAALFFTSVALAATDLAPPEGRTRALGRQSVMTYTGFTLGPIIADRLLDHGWTVVWLVPAALHVITAFIASPVKETKPQGGGPSTARAGFDRRVVRPAAGIFVANFTFSAIVAFLPEYAERNGISRPGALFATYAIAVLLVRALTGGYADRIGPARFTVGTMSFGALGLLALAFASDPWQSYVAIAAVGMSIGSTFPAATAAALQRSSGSDRGRAMGTALAVGDLGQASAGPLVGFISTQLGFRWVYGIPSLMAVVAVGVVATMPNVMRPTRVAPVGS